MANEFISTRLLQTALPVLGLGLLTRAALSQNGSTCHYFSRNCKEFTGDYNVSDRQRSHWFNSQAAFE